MTKKETDKMKAMAALLVGMVLFGGFYLIFATLGYYISNGGILYYVINESCNEERKIVQNLKDTESVLLNGTDRLTVTWGSGCAHPEMREVSYFKYLILTPKEIFSEHGIEERIVEE